MISSTKNLLFTVLIPAYNIAPYIAECLNSVAASMGDDTDTEILVVDDGSTDGTGQILDEYALKCPAIRVIHQANQGAAVARNVAMALAKGQYIVFVDGDDTVTKEALPSLRKCITDYKEKHEGVTVDLVANKKFIRVYSDGSENVLERNYDSWKAFPVDKVFLHYLHASATFVAPWHYCVRVDFIRNKKLYFEPFLLSSQDRELTPRMFLAAQSVVLNDTICYRHRMEREGGLKATGHKRRCFYETRITSLWWYKFHAGDYTGKRLEAAEFFVRRDYSRRIIWIQQEEQKEWYGELLKAFEKTAFVLEGSKNKQDIALLKMIRRHGVRYAQKEFPEYCKRLSTPPRKGLKSKTKHRLTSNMLWQKVLKPARRGVKHALVKSALWQKVLKPVRDKMRRK